MSSAREDKILEVRDVEFGYARRQFITGLTFSIGDGEFIGLLGPNGSGKSTILKLAGGILKPSTGDIELWNKPLLSYRNRDRAKLLCYLPQLLDLNIPFKVEEIVRMGIYPYDIAPVTSVSEALEMVGLTEKAGHTITTLSGGERRRVFIAMTLLQGAGLLLLDEPLANLDIKYQIELFRLLLQLRDAKGISILMALHDINIALQMDRIMLIRNGMVIASGKPFDVLTSERLKEAFDVNVEIKMSDDGKAYLRYEHNFES